MRQPAFVLLVQWANQAWGTLPTAETLAQRARQLSKSGDKKLGRGFLSLALHIDPFLGQEKSTEWVAQAVHKEEMGYWKGNLFVGLDKTHIESLFSTSGLLQGTDKNAAVIYAWRNLELTGLSCCGMDNVAVFFSQANKHMYVAPFMDLVPGYIETLKPDNRNMYTGFRKWWEETGRRPMPEPKVTYHGNGKFEWPATKVVMRSSRIPGGWSDMIQAVLLYRINAHEDARTCLRSALHKNADLTSLVNELMPHFPTPAVSNVPAVAEQTKYIIQYNQHVGLGNLAVVMVSSHMLAKLTGRKFVLHWNVNTVVRQAFKVREHSDVAVLDESNVADEIGIVPKHVKTLYLFHMMASPHLGEILELFGCSDIRKELDSHRVVSVSSNMFFAPIIAQNPHAPPGIEANFPQMLKELLTPSSEAASKALGFARKVQWGNSVPVVAIHIRAREEGEDNDDWPTRDSPTKHMLDKLRKCTEKAVATELKNTGNWLWTKEPVWDLFIASTTEKARKAASHALKGAKGLRNILTMDTSLLKRKSAQGSVDAMAEALLLSRANIFVRLVIGSSGFSTFAYLSNALRSQNDWVKGMPELERSGYAPNYLITEDCGLGRCFVAPPEVRMANIAWHGKQFTHRSCGDVLQKAELEGGTETIGCRGLRALDDEVEL